MLFKPNCSLFVPLSHIIVAMLASVNFYYQFIIKIYEINDILPYDLLSAKFST